MWKKSSESWWEASGWQHPAMGWGSSQSRWRAFFWLQSNTQHENQGLEVTRYFVFSCSQNPRGLRVKSSCDHKCHFTQCSLPAELKMLCKCLQRWWKGSSKQWNKLSNLTQPLTIALWLEINLLARALRRKYPPLTASITVSINRLPCKPCQKKKKKSFQVTLCESRQQSMGTTVGKS